MNSHQQIDALINALDTYKVIMDTVEATPDQHWSHAVKSNPGLKGLWPQIKDAAEYADLNLFNQNGDGGDAMNLDNYWGLHAAQVALGLIESGAYGPGEVWPKPLVTNGAAEYWLLRWGKEEDYYDYEGYGDAGGWLF